MDHFICSLLFSTRGIGGEVWSGAFCRDFIININMFPIARRLPWLCKPRAHRGGFLNDRCIIIKILTH